MISGTIIRTMPEFLAADIAYVLPAPGGSIANGGGPASNLPADGYLSAIAGQIKEKKMNPTEAIRFLHRKIMHVEGQLIFNKEDDLAMIARMEAWIMELAS